MKKLKEEDDARVAKNRAEYREQKKRVKAIESMIKEAKTKAEMEKLEVEKMEAFEKLMAICAGDRCRCKVQCEQRNRIDLDLVYSVKCK